MNFESFIRQCVWFNGALDSAFGALIEAARSKRFDQKNICIDWAKKGSLCTVWYWVCAYTNQQYSRTRVCDHGVFVQLVARRIYLNQPTRMFEAQVLDNSSIIQIPKRIVKTLAEEHSVIYQNLFLAQAEKTLQLCEFLGGMLFYPLSARVAGGCNGLHKIMGYRLRKAF
jgi:hypothetical protein